MGRRWPSPLRGAAGPPRAAVAGPPVTILGGDPHPKRTRVALLRTAEAADVAAIIDRVRAEGWTVRTGPGGEPTSGPPA